MMPLLTPTDVRGPSRLKDAAATAASDRERERRERQELVEENRRLIAENERLNEENAALREAAAIWIRLYEKQLERANDPTSFKRAPRSILAR